MKVKGRRYKVPIVRSFLDWSHGAYEIIEEIYVPELGLAFNKEGCVFRANEDRYKPMKLPSGKEVPVEYLGEVDISKEDAEFLLKFIKLKEKVEIIIGKYF